MRCAGSKRPVRVLVEQCLQGALIGGLVGEFVLPVMPDDAEPGAGEDARRVGMVVSCDPSKISDTRMVYQ
jgi:hypothetical protein